MELITILKQPYKNPHEIMEAKQKVKNIKEATRKFEIYLVEFQQYANKLTLLKEVKLTFLKD